MFFSKENVFEAILVLTYIFNYTINMATYFSIFWEVNQKQISKAKIDDTQAELLRVQKTANITIDDFFYELHP